MWIWIFSFGRWIYMDSQQNTDKGILFTLLCSTFLGDLITASTKIRGHICLPLTIRLKFNLITSSYWRSEYYHVHCIDESSKVQRGEVPKLRTGKSRSKATFTSKSAVKKFICLPEGTRTANALSQGSVFLSVIFDCVSIGRNSQAPTSRRNGLFRNRTPIVKTYLCRWVEQSGGPQVIEHGNKSGPGGCRVCVALSRFAARRQNSGGESMPQCAQLARSQWSQASPGLWRAFTPSLCFSFMNVSWHNQNPWRPRAQGRSFQPQECVPLTFHLEVMFDFCERTWPCPGITCKEYPMSMGNQNNSLD